MKIIEINEAEAIIEPFFDGGTSDYTDPDPRYRVLDEYQVQALNGAVARAEQAWAFANLSVDRTVPGKPVLQLRPELGQRQGYRRRPSGARSDPGSKRRRNPMPGPEQKPRRRCHPSSARSAPGSRRRQNPMPGPAQLQEPG